MDKHENKTDISKEDRKRLAQQLRERTSQSDYVQSADRLLSTRDLEAFHGARVIPFDGHIRLTLAHRRGDTPGAVRFYVDGGQYEKKKTCGGIGLIGLDERDAVVCVATAGLITKSGEMLSTTDIETVGVMLCGYINEKAVKAKEATLYCDCKYSVQVAQELLPRSPSAQWVRGHTRNHGNTCADALARHALNAVASQAPSGVNSDTWRGTARLRTVDGIAFLHHESLIRTRKSKEEDSPDIYVLAYGLEPASTNYAIIYANRRSGRIFKMDSGRIMTTEGKAMQALAAILPQHREGTRLRLSKPLISALSGEDDSPDAQGFKDILEKKGHHDFRPNDAFRESVVKEVACCKRESELMTLLRSQVTPAFQKVCFKRTRHHAPQRPSQSPSPAPRQGF